MRAAVSPEAKEAFAPLGEAPAEPAKSAALPAFGALPTPIAHMFDVDDLVGIPDDEDDQADGVPGALGQERKTTV